MLPDPELLTVEDMAYHHHSRETSASSPLARRKYPLRRSPPHRRLIPSASIGPRVATGDPRPVLVPLHPNLRRLPSRLTFQEKIDEMYNPPQHIQIGSKRKRVFSTNENSNGHGRPTRGDGRPKRLKTVSGRRTEYSSDSDTSAASGMDIDSANEQSDECIENDTEEGSSSEEEDAQNSEDENSDEEDENCLSHFRLFRL